MLAAETLQPMGCKIALWDLEIELANCHDSQLTDVEVELFSSKKTLLFYGVWWISEQLMKYLRQIRAGST
jgi:hypothetical protein